MIRCWQFSQRPGRPTIPYRCTVHVKCTDCAAAWWHGVALTATAWFRRPRPTGIRALLMRGSNFEPVIWAGDRKGKR